MNNKEAEEELFKLFIYEKIIDDTYIIKSLKNKYIYELDIPEGVVTICEEAFANSKLLDVDLNKNIILGVNVFTGTLKEKVDQKVD